MERYALRMLCSAAVSARRRGCGDALCGGLCDVLRNVLRDARVCTSAAVRISCSKRRRFAWSPCSRCWTSRSRSLSASSLDSSARTTSNEIAAWTGGDAALCVSETARGGGGPCGAFARRCRGCRAPCCARAAAAKPSLVSCSQLRRSRAFVRRSPRSSAGESASPPRIAYAPKEEATTRARGQLPGPNRPDADWWNLEVSSSRDI